MTTEELKEMRNAIEDIDFSKPIKQYPDDKYLDKDVKELLSLMKKRMKEDPSLIKDPMWADEYDQLQRIADYRGINVE